MPEEHTPHDQGAWERIKQHKVAQWTVAYGAVAFALLQGLDIVANTFNWPRGAMRGITVLMVIGAPLVALLAWYHGHQRARRVTRTELAILTIILGVGGAALWWVGRAPAEHERTLPTTQIASPPKFAPSEQSVAVLPFVNLSGDPKDEYFSDGLSEELLSTLVRVRELQVAGRTSAFSFKGTQTDIPTVGRKLNVAAVLEGSVRRAGDRLRISAQLVNTVTGFTLWSATLDRAMTDVLEMQTDIAARVARALKVRLVDEKRERLSIGTSRNSRALDAYFRGLRLLHADDRGSVAEGIAAMDEAIALDPHFARAYGVRASGRIVQTMQMTDTPKRQAMSTQALADAKRGIELAPDSGEAHQKLAYVLMYSPGEHLKAALEELERARALEPGDAHIQAVYSVAAGTIGRADALDAANRAVALDPLNPDPHNGRAAVLYWQHRYAEGLASAQTAVRLDDHFFYRNTASRLLYALGRFEEALELTRNDTEEWAIKGFHAMIHGRLGRQQEAEAELTAVQNALGDEGSFLYAVIYAQWGQTDEAIRRLETAVELKADVADIRVEPLLDPLRSEPRFKALEARVNLPH